MKCIIVRNHIQWHLYSPVDYITQLNPYELCCLANFSYPKFTVLFVRITCVERKHMYYSNWPQYGLHWSGFCCHSRHSTSGTGRRAAPCCRPHECCAGSGSTNHCSTDRMSSQFLFYHENKAIHNDKSRDDDDDEPPCWNALAGNAIVLMKASIDTVSEW